MERIDSKHEDFFINAHMEYDCSFYAWINPVDNKIISSERISGNWPEISVVSWDNEEEFFAGITWYDWIVEGFKKEGEMYSKFEKRRNRNGSSKRK